MAYLLRVKTVRDLNGLYLGEEIPFRFKSIKAIADFIDMCEANKYSVMSYEIREDNEDEDALEEAYES